MTITERSYQEVIMEERGFVKRQVSSQVWVVQRADNAMQQIYHYPVITKSPLYPLDSDKVIRPSHNRGQGAWPNSK